MKQYKIGFIILLIPLILIAVSCEHREYVNPGTDPNFTIVANSDPWLGFGEFTRKVDVFGINIFAVDEVTDQRLLHAANVMAQYLDNDEDGIVDNQQVLNSILESNAFLVMWKHDNDLTRPFLTNPIRSFSGQDLGNDETIPSWYASGKAGRFDASIEEIWHLISDHGYAKVYPEVFVTQPNSEIAIAMDIARGGHFTEIPDTYPADAWYTYYDESCNYGCMVSEYFYWALTSTLNAHENRMFEIQHEWLLYTKDLLQSTDTSVYAILTNPEYKLPTKLPDGTYRH